LNSVTDKENDVDKMHSVQSRILYIRVLLPNLLCSVFLCNADDKGTACKIVQDHCQLHCTDQAAEQMINMVQKFFYDHTAPEDQLDVDSYIPSATEEVITVIADMVDEMKGEGADSVKLLQEGAAG
jgi:hypothetical protein